MVRKKLGSEFCAYCLKDLKKRDRKEVNGRSTEGKIEESIWYIVGMKKWGPGGRDHEEGWKCGRTAYTTTSILPSLTFAFH